MCNEEVDEQRLSYVIRPGELPEVLTSKLVIPTASLILGIEVATMDLSSFHGNHCTPWAHLPVLAERYAFVSRSAYRRPTNTILLVLPVATTTKVLAGIVEPVSIDVVDLICDPFAS